MVGSGTVLKDNPGLNVRGVKGAANPVRVVLDSRFRTPLKAKIFSTRGGKVIIYTTKRATAKKIQEARSLGAEVVVLPKTKEGLSVKRAMRDMAKRGITSVMLEGGAKLAASMLKVSLVDKLSLFIAPKILGGDALAAVGALDIKSLKKAVVLKSMKERKLGADILIEGYL
jgi:diaminohydroxyphosphoribosylaminopyrimidine deaminase/5-amino-6-(5-phosphoribosylamino)uracil reductase